MGNEKNPSVVKLISLIRLLYRPTTLLKCLSQPFVFCPNSTNNRFVNEKLIVKSQNKFLINKTVICAMHCVDI